MNIRSTFNFFFVLVCVSLWSSIMADEPDSEKTVPNHVFTFELPKLKFGVKTLGGRQFWGDRLHFRGWRIQHNVLTSHHRLLDRNDYRFASGTFQECQQALDEIKTEQKLKPMSGKAVIFLHGIMRSSKSFHKMASAFEAQDITVVPFDYPSTQVDLGLCADYLDDVIRSLEGVEEIHMICHSMGGLVVRKYVAEHQDKRIKSVIMLGTPNSGSEMANLLQGNPLYKAIMGPAGQDLVVDPEGTIAKLPKPKFEYAVVAGINGSLEGYNPLLPGEDDGTVSLSSAMLPGACDSLKVTSLHSFLMDHPVAIESCVRFVTTGAFSKSGQRVPVPNETVTSRAKK